jgi:hypothetical protein
MQFEIRDACHSRNRGAFAIGWGVIVCVARKLDLIVIEGCAIEPIATAHGSYNRFGIFHPPRLHQYPKLKVRCLVLRVGLQ